jgi:hypothetical protein
MSDLHTNGTADRAPAGAQDDIVEQLEWHNTCVRNADGLCLLQQALYKIEHQQAEIERLTQHSIILNRVSWQLHDALGMIPEGADSYRGDIEATLPTICQIIKEARRG